MFKLINICLLSIFILCGCTQKQDPSVKWQPKIDKYLMFWNTGEFSDIENTLDQEFEMRMSPGFEPRIGIETFKESVTKFRSTYPGFTINLIEAIYIENSGAGRWIMSATSKTRKKLEVMSISILHFRNGKIKDE